MLVVDQSWIKMPQNKKEQKREREEKWFERSIGRNISVSMI